MLRTAAIIESRLYLYLLIELVDFAAQRNDLIKCMRATVDTTCYVAEKVFLLPFDIVID